MAATATKLPLAQKRALLPATTADKRDTSPVTVLVKPRRRPAISVDRKATFLVIAQTQATVEIGEVIVAPNVTAVAKLVTLLVTALALLITAVVAVVAAVADEVVVVADMEVVEDTVPSVEAIKRLASPAVV